ncbi:hypothetical protein DMC25_10520 [Caulobacter sp. D4A]|uniref:hypothetical protein n=1 Tax=unclassified Caulobacter TaxID=2648921 RepID=UPI000D72558D|nr:MULTISPECIES: hypothetical protein [unclassified Caulobacter]PXA88740.1 hypothetical protein DMC25_10520 [Caulobacter sp. D4A]PXA95456.1 hypothetical protein DMC18_03905 [Caulobacter sp. D5]
MTTDSRAAGARPLVLVIAVATLVAGTLDITDAFTFWAVTKGVSPERILQSIASGLLGKAAFQGGTATAALGLVLHYFIMSVMAGLYVAAARRLPVLVRRPLLMGLAYGAATYVVMNYGVLPLSAVAPPSAFAWPRFINNLGAHLVLVGVPIALVARWGAGKAAAEAS